MEGIKIEVTGNIARVTQKPTKITSGTVGLPVEFTFDSQWDGLDKKAVFQGGHTIKTVDFSEADTVPWEVLVKPKVCLSVGVYGVNEDGSVAIPTTWANVGRIHVGVNPDGDPTTDPTLPIWQTIMNSIKFENLTEEEKAQIRQNLGITDDGGASTLIVTWFDEEHRDRATHGAVDILPHVESGGVVVFDDGGCFYSLQYVDEGQAIFFHPGDDHIHMLINIGTQGEVYEEELNTVSQENFDSAIGDISTALDAIIDMQEELIGGAEV